MDASSRACRSAGRAASCRGRRRSRRCRSFAFSGVSSHAARCRSRPPARARGAGPWSPSDSGCVPTSGAHHRHDRIGRLGEEERRLLRSASPPISLRVLGVVAADAEDVADRKALGAIPAMGTARRIPQREVRKSVAGIAIFRSAWRVRGCQRRNAGSARTFGHPRRAGSQAPHRRTPAARGTSARCGSSVGYGVRSMSTRRALASCGTRQMSASVGASPWQKRPVRRVARQRLLERFEADVDPVRVPRVLLRLVHAHRVQEVAQHAQVVDRMDVAGDRMRDAADARALVGGPGQQRRLTDSSRRGTR